MIHPVLFIPIWVLSFFGMPFAQQFEPLLTIEFSQDSKDGRETGHTVIRYYLAETGQEYDVRDVYDWALQASHRRQLSRDEVAKIKSLLQVLPASGNGDIPKDRLVTVTFRDGTEVRVREYHRKKLPPRLKEILELLREIRFELRDTVEFSRVNY